MEKNYDARNVIRELMLSHSKKKILTSALTL